MPRFVLATMAAIAVAVPARGQSPVPPLADGWQTRFIGQGRGSASLSLGAIFWKDYFRIRNLIARTTLDLAPGIRAHVMARRREGSWQRRPLHPDIDEAYLEGSTFYHSPTFDLALNGKAGRVRYLHFPAPDRLALFDQVPGIADLTGGPITDYRGALLTIEGAHRSGLGFHFGGIQWGFDAPSSGTNAIEWYGFFRRDVPGGWSVEGRGGALAARQEPLGRPAHLGASGFIGKRLGEFEIGAMVEKRRGDPTYTGLMVQFRPTPITRALGAVGFDYDRTPDGIALQYDLFRLRINEDTKAEPGEDLVGEVRAIRLRTYWQAGFQRNEYEHRLSSWGVTGGPGIRTVVKEEPWHLEVEALVSPHTPFTRAWFRDRQGPAQLAQRVVYRFYRKSA